MIKTVCVKHCAEPFCVPACPSGALKVSDGEIVVDQEKCHGCGLCRVMCMTWSRDHTMRTKSRFWLAGRL
ncbi:MAG: 4Fe-4S binding protein [Dehalococcoidales bacterium]|nr:4Fe-4S binding protein [Dehalococcoidales bacterium]